MSNPISTQNPRFGNTFQTTPTQRPRGDTVGRPARISGHPVDNSIPTRHGRYCSSPPIEQRVPKTAPNSNSQQENTHSPKITTVFQQTTIVEQQGSAATKEDIEKFFNSYVPIHLIIPPQSQFSANSSFVGQPIEIVLPCSSPQTTTEIPQGLSPDSMPYRQD